MKKWIAGVWLLVLMTIIASFFWFNQLVYSLPTPIPDKYVAVEVGRKVNIKPKLTFPNDKPVFLHFFNPDCPCSRFNIPQFEKLIKNYSGKVNFAVVLMSDKPFTEKDIQERFGLKIPVIKDDSLAISCGVYSTPQAVILLKSNTLYYRGNYNKSRYCTDEKTSYAKQALDEALMGSKTIHVDPLALIAYGCKLPDCKN